MKENINMYEVWNGYVGYGHIRSYVVARSEEEAIELARPGFYKQAKKSRRYPDEYYTNLNAEMLGRNVQGGFASEPSD